MTDSRAPAGFRYRPELIDPPHEVALVAQVRDLPFRAFEFRGYTGKRRVVSSGWQYDFGAQTLHRADDIPPVASLRYSITFRNLGD